MTDDDAINDQDDLSDLQKYATEQQQKADNLLRRALHLTVIAGLTGGIMASYFVTRFHIGPWMPAIICAAIGACVALFPPSHFPMYIIISLSVGAGYIAAMLAIALGLPTWGLPILLLILLAVMQIIARR